MTLIYCALLFTTPATVLRGNQCPQGNEEFFLETYQYLLCAELALRGSELWVKENPTSHDERYLGALNPQKNPDPKAKTVHLAFMGIKQDPELNSSLLHTNWVDPQVKTNPWHRFLKEKDQFKKLQHLKQVRFDELKLHKKSKHPIEPWIYAVLKRETSGMLALWLEKLPRDDPFYALAYGMMAAIDLVPLNQLQEILADLELPKQLQAPKDSIKDKVLFLIQNQAIPEDQKRQFFKIKYLHGQSQLLNGFVPNPTDADGEGYERLHWQAYDFWLSQLIFQLFRMEQHATIKELVKNQFSMKQRRKCNYQAAITQALLRYAADPLFTEGHDDERNFLNDLGFNGLTLVYQLEIISIRDGSRR